jgi:hypothetical protein
MKNAPIVISGYLALRVRVSAAKKDHTTATPGNVAEHAMADAITEHQRGGVTGKIVLLGFASSRQTDHGEKS